MEDLTQTISNIVGILLGLVGAVGVGFLSTGLPLPHRLGSPTPDGEMIQTVGVDICESLRYDLTLAKEPSCILCGHT